MIRTIDQYKLEKAKREKVEFKLGDYFNEAFSIYGKHWVDFSLFAFVSGLILVLATITIIGPYLIIFPLQMGYGNVVDKIEKGESFVFNDFFIGFRKWTSFIPYLFLIIGLGLVLIIPYIFILGSFGLFMDTPEVVGPIFGLSMVVIFPIYFIVGILLTVILYLPPYFIFHGNMKAIESLKISIAIAKKNFWYLLLFILFFSILSQIGVYVCIIGLFVSMPIAYVMNYLMIKDILLNENNYEIDTIGQSQEL